MHHIKVKIDFGVKNEEKDGCSPCASPSKFEKKERYPTVCFRDEHADLLKQAIGESPEMGDEIVITTTFRVTGIRNDQYGKSTDLDVVDMDGAAEVTPTTDSEDSAEDTADSADSKTAKSDSTSKPADGMTVDIAVVDEKKKRNKLMGISSKY